MFYKNPAPFAIQPLLPADGKVDGDGGLGAVNVVSDKQGWWLLLSVVVVVMVYVLVYVVVLVSACPASSTTTTTASTTTTIAITYTTATATFWGSWGPRGVEQ